MGSSARRNRNMARVRNGSPATRHQDMSPGTKLKVQSGYRRAGKTLAGDFQAAYLNQDAKHKATARSRKALPSDPAKRAKVLQTLMADDASKVLTTTSS